MKYWVAYLASVAGLAIIAGLLWDSHEKVRLIRSSFPAILADQSLVKASIGRGHNLFRAHCQTCHLSNGKGDSDHGVPDLTDGVWLHIDGSPQDIERIIAHGIRAHDPRGAGSLAYMPAYGRQVPYGPYPINALTPGQISQLADYVRSLAGEKPSRSTAISQGQSLYSGSAGCADCHGQDGRGDSAIGAPDLTQSKRLWGNGDHASLTNSISQGLAGACPAFSRTLNSSQIRDLSLYLYSLNRPLQDKTGTRQ